MATKGKNTAGPRASRAASATAKRKSPGSKQALRGSGARTTGKHHASSKAKASSTSSPKPKRLPDGTAPEEYYDLLPEDRRVVMLQLRAAIKKSLPKGFDEVIQYGMPGWVVPLSTYPPGYHCAPNTPLPFIGIASQISHIAVYHMGLYADPALLKWFAGEWKARVGTKLDMGKSCLRFKKPEAVRVDLIAALCTKVTPSQWVSLYEEKFRR